MASFSSRRAIGWVAYLPVACGLFLLTGCPGETPTKKNGGAVATEKHGAHDAHPGDHDAHDHDSDHDHEAGHHHHHPEHGPHHGALVAVGDEDAHLEIVLDPQTGKLTAYVLDAEAAKPVSIKQAELQLGITLELQEGEGKDDLGGEVFSLALAAVDPQDGMSAEFAGQSDQLKKVEHFDAALTSITVGEKTFKNVTFSYPEGNEHHH